MSKRKDGGPAFPGGESYYTTDVMGCRTDHDKAPLHRGMSLRDWLAGQALCRLTVAEADRLVAASEPGSWECERPGGYTVPASVAIERLARAAYMTADAMLAAREEVRP